MSGHRAAQRAYQTASAHRNLREQEAEILRQVNAGLRRIESGGTTTLARVRALADNERLWAALVGNVKDPQNRLPESLRGAIVSIGLAVQREMRSSKPDLGFLVEVNENIAAGLAAG